MVCYARVQTNLSFLKSDSARASLWWKASKKGLSQEIIEPSFLALVVLGTFSPDVKKRSPCVPGLDKCSVLVSLRGIPYRVASVSSVVRKLCSCGVVKEIRSVSSAYSKSYVGFPTMTHINTPKPATPNVDARFTSARTRHSSAASQRAPTSHCPCRCVSVSKGPAYVCLCTRLPGAKQCDRDWFG